MISNLIINSPHCSCYQVPLSVVYVNSFLKEKNLKSEVLDLNGKFNNYLIRKNKDKDLFSKIRTMKDPKSDYSKYRAALVDAEGIYEDISSIYSPTKFTLDGVNFGVKYTERDIEAIINDVSLNPYIEFYIGYLDLIVENYNCVGFSISYESQLIPTLILAHMIKNKNKNIKIYAGGSYISNISNQESAYKWMFKYLDVINIYEAEISLHMLIENINNIHKYCDIPNLIYVENEQIVRTIEVKNKKVSKPAITFEGINFEDYLTPMPIIPLMIMRKPCYWGKCTFCIHDDGISEIYTDSSFDDTINEIIRLKGIYKTDLFDFIAENALTHDELIEFSKKIIERDVRIKWRTHYRISKESHDFDILRKAGCTALFIGIESGSQKMLNKMKKGTTVELYDEKLKQIYEAGIFVRASFISSFPQEKISDVIETFKLIKENKKYIQFASFNKFELREGSHVFNNPSKYGIQIVQRNEYEIQSYFDFAYEDNHDSLKRHASCVAFLIDTYNNYETINRLPGNMLFYFISQYDTLESALEQFSSNN